MPFLGPLGLALVGTPDELAAAIMTYRRAGVSQILGNGEGMSTFCQEVLPRVRALE